LANDANNFSLMLIHLKSLRFVFYKPHFERLG